MKNNGMPPKISYGRPHPQNQANSPNQQDQQNQQNQQNGANPQMQSPPPKKRVGRKRNPYALDLWNKFIIVLMAITFLSSTIVLPVFFSIVNDDSALKWDKEALSTVSNSRIFDSEGNIVYEFGAEIRDDVTYEEIPQVMIDAFLSIEDSRYFEHNGFDLPRFLAAAVSNLRSGGLGQGGSTLTMQMIDNNFTMVKEQELEEEQGYVSTLDKLKLKVQEIYLAMYCEGNLTKEDIFEYYINRIWFGSGNNTRGLQKATQYFFNKDVTQLNLGEAAFLAGAINSPATYNPLNNRISDDFDYLAAATSRRNVVLQLMLNHGYISELEYNLAVHSKLEFALKTTKVTNTDPNEAYITQVIEEAQEMMNGQDPAIVPMDIYTSLNQDLQKQADLICKGEIDEVVYPDDKFDIGFTIIDNSTGEILAVGPGRTYHEQDIKIDNSTDRKQPGSSMKPILAYAPCFDVLGWSTGHIVNDVAKDYWKCGVNLQNSSGTYKGKVTLEYALGVSLNTTAAQAMLDLMEMRPASEWQTYCAKLGYDDDVVEEFNEQYSIGGSSMWASPIQQASAYTMLGNGGARVEAHRIRKIVNRDSGTVTQKDAEEYTLISTQAAFMMSTLLEKVVSGNYQNLNEILYNKEYPVYGKSGTSDWGDVGLQYGIPRSAIRDEWSLAYTNQFTVAVWTGYMREDFEQGYYPSLNDIMNYATAFHASNYLLKYAQKYADGGSYSAIARPEGISDYNGHYIKAEFKETGDVTKIEKEKDEDEDEDKDKDEESKDETIVDEVDEDPDNTDPTAAHKTMKDSCEAQGYTWDDEAEVCKAKVPTEVTVKPTTTETPEMTACKNSGGFWANGCICGTGTQLNSSGVCEAVAEDPEPEETTPSTSPGDSSNNTTVIPDTSTNPGDTGVTDTETSSP